MFKSLALAAAAALTASVSGAATLLYENDFETMNGNGYVYDGGGAAAYVSPSPNPAGTTLTYMAGSTFDQVDSRMRVEDGRMVFSGINGIGAVNLDMYSYLVSYGTTFGGYRLTFDVSSSANVDSSDVISTWWSNDVSNWVGVGGPTSTNGGDEGNIVWRGGDGSKTIDMLLPLTDPHYYLTVNVGASVLGAGEELYVDNLSLFKLETEEFAAEAAARAAAGTLETVPLPSSALLMLGGLGGLALMRRRR